MPGHQRVGVEQHHPQPARFPLDLRVGLRREVVGALLRQPGPLAEWQRLYDATADDGNAPSTPADRAFDAYSRAVWPATGHPTGDERDLPGWLLALSITTR